MLRYFLGRQTLKHSSVTFLGTIINGLFGAAFYILIARFLGPVDFGLLFVSITTLTLIADIADLGTNTGLVKFVSANLAQNNTKVLQFLKLSLEIKILSGVLVLIIGYLLAPTITSLIFRKPELLFPMRLVMFGVGGSLLFTYTTSTLQAYQKFVWWSTLNVLTNFLRLLLVVMLLLTGWLNLQTSLVSFIALPFFGFFLSLFLIPTRQLIRVRDELAVAGELFKYNRSVAAFILLAAISARLDTFLSARLLNNYEVGLYSSANQLTSIIPQLVGAIGVVLAPKFSAIRSRLEMIGFLKKSLLMVLGIGGLAVIVLPLAVFLIPILYGNSYLGMIPPFIILYISMLVLLLSAPIHSTIFYFYGKPELFIWISLVNLLLIATLGYLLISSLGIIGASLTVLISQILSLVITSVWLIKEIKNG